MRMKMRKCDSCGEYTLKDRCPNCGGEVHVPCPPKYSPENKYGKYRRILKKQIFSKKEEGEVK